LIVAGLQAACGGYGGRLVDGGWSRGALSASGILANVRMGLISDYFDSTRSPFFETCVYVTCTRALYIYHQKPTLYMYSLTNILNSVRFGESQIAMAVSISHNRCSFVCFITFGFYDMSCGAPC
jgi:hypothetical protein